VTCPPGSCSGDVVGYDLVEEDNVDEHGEYRREPAGAENEPAPDTAPEEQGGETDEDTDDRPWSGWASFAEIQDAVSGLVDSALKNVAPATGRFPRYDLLELPSEGYMILFDLPGMEKSEVEVSAAGTDVTVEGARSRPTLPDGAKVQRSERTFGRFSRTVRVPGNVDMGGIRAKMTNGVLEIRLPLRHAEDAQRIKVD